MQKYESANTMEFSFVLACQGTIRWVVFADNDSTRLHADSGDWNRLSPVSC